MRTFASDRACALGINFVSWT